MDSGKDFVRPWVTADLTASLTFTKAWKKTSFRNGANRLSYGADLYEMFGFDRREEFEPDLEAFRLQELAKHKIELGQAARCTEPEPKQPFPRR